MDRNIAKSIIYVLFVIALSSCGGGGSPTNSQPFVPEPAVYVIPPSLSTCINSLSRRFPCFNLSFQGQLTAQMMGGQLVTDVFGWVDTITNKEYAIVGMDNGTAFVDISAPASPILNGFLPSQAGSSIFREVNVYKGFAYIVAGDAGSHGMQIFNLNRLRELPQSQINMNLEADSIFGGVDEGFGLEINQATGFAYITSTNCPDQLAIVDIESPISPVFVGCHPVDTAVFSTQCVQYDGPDMSYQNKEICIFANGNYVEISDLTTKDQVVSVANLFYEDVGLTWKASFTDDHEFVLITDIFDEIDFETSTRIYVFNVRDLDNPYLAFTYEADSGAVDFDLSIRGDLAFLANTSEGLRILDLSNVSSGQIKEVAYIDTSLARDEVEIYGVWSIFSDLPSGVILVGDVSEGLMLMTFDGNQVFAGQDVVVSENEKVKLNGFASGPNGIASIMWEQISGPVVQLEHIATLEPEFTSPSVTHLEKIRFQVTVESTVGEVLSDSIDVFVEPYWNVLNLNLSDPILGKCIVDEAESSDLESLLQITSINCNDVTDISGIEHLLLLERLTLNNHSIRNLNPLLLLGAIKIIDLRGGVPLFCDKENIFFSEISDDVEVLTDDLCWEKSMLDLQGVVQDSVYHEASNMLYISVPKLKEIAVLDLDTHVIVDRILVPGNPFRMDISIDGSFLFVALRGQNAVLKINLVTRASETISLLDVAGNPDTEDVKEVAPGVLFVTSSGRNGKSYLVKVLLGDINVPSRIISDLRLSLYPSITVSPNYDYAYLNQGSSLYKISLMNSSMEITEQTGGIAGGSNAVIDNSGSYMAFRSGNIFKTTNLTGIATIADGPLAKSEAGNNVMVHLGGGVIEYFDFVTGNSIKIVETTCPARFNSVAYFRMNSISQDNGYVLISDDEICVIGGKEDIAVGMFPLLSIPDLALRECIEDEAEINGWIDPGDFTSLDCSYSGKVIRNLSGLENFSNLEVLDLSNSQLMDFSILESLIDLRFLSIQNSQLTSLHGLSELPYLIDLDVTGNFELECDQLSQLASMGVNIATDKCLKNLIIELEDTGMDLELDIANGRAYVSILELEKVVVLELDDLTISTSWPVTGMPWGLKLSLDGSTLFVATGEGDAYISYLEVLSGNEQIVDTPPSISSSANQIVEVSPGRLFVVGRLRNIVEIRRDMNNAAQNVETPLSIFEYPILQANQETGDIFLSDSHYVYKFKTNQEEVTFSQQVEFGEGRRGRNIISLSADGKLLYLSNGRVLDTTTLNEVGRLKQGIPLASEDNERVYVTSENSNIVTVYSAGTHEVIDYLYLPCDADYHSQIGELSANNLIFLSENLVCTSSVVNYQ